MENNNSIDLAINESKEQIQWAEHEIRKLMQRIEHYENIKEFHSVVINELIGADQNDALRCN